MNVENFLSVNSLIESTIRTEEYIIYLMMMQEMYHTLMISCIVLRYDKFNDSKIVMRALIDTRQ